MKRDGGMSTALHLVLVWALMSAVVPALGFALMVAGWGGGTAAVVPVFLVGVPLTVGLLASIPVTTFVPLRRSTPRRLGWAVLVFALGTLGVLAGVAAYAGGVDLGSAGVRIALTGTPYAVAAAFLVPSRRVWLGALTVLVAGVAYGGYVGPAQAEQRRHEGEVARYRERPELLVLVDTPPRMAMGRAEVGPAAFEVEYHLLPQREVEESGYVGLMVRVPLTPAPQCPVLLEDVTCTVDAHGDVVTVVEYPGGNRTVTVTRRHGDAEVSVASPTVDEAGLRRLLDTLHPVSDAELATLMREKTITHRN
ncbi:hypothetical protein [Kitasatospora camelliae]|uniref:Uncharacterized protein n=1 Tax=Kitasatospora camelliae TaxID=3156397 RepID=A0AAU8JSW8_9ACTN